MASANKGTGTLGYEPQRRTGHALVEYKGCTYLVGGRGSNGQPIDLSLVEIFDPTTLKWQCHTTTGEIPNEAYRAAYAVVCNCLYVFGGLVNGEVSNALWRLDLESFQWSSVQQTNKPQPRRAAGMVADKEQRLVLYGGIDEDGLKTDLSIFSISDGE